MVLEMFANTLILSSPRSARFSLSVSRILGSVDDVTESSTGQRQLFVIDFSSLAQYFRAFLCYDSTAQFCRVRSVTASHRKSGEAFVSSSIVTNAI